MITYECSCGGRLFFGNSACHGCGSEVAWCEACRTVAPLQPADAGFRCGNLACGESVTKCRNYVEEGACNRALPLAAPRAANSPVADSAGGNGLCKACRLNETIPDLSVEGNRERWAKLETAKRRLLYQLDELGLRYAAEDLPANVKPLRFSFVASTPEAPVLTGHADGLVTINIAEADSVERERVRVQMGEPQRTLLGHMRHEIGHYYWMTLVAGRCEDAFAATFGDHRQPPYPEALARYHESGPPADWPARFVSAYATAHPWEDFAETWGLYLDLRAVLTTTHHHFPALVAGPNGRPIETLIADYQHLGVVFNEINRTMGLTDLVPEVVAPPVAEKLAWIDQLVRRDVP